MTGDGALFRAAASTQGRNWRVMPRVIVLRMLRAETVLPTANSATRNTIAPMVEHTKLRLCIAGAVAAFLVTVGPALAVDQVHDEIQVYNAEIAAVGQWTYEQHLNYAVAGQTQPEFPGGFTSNRSLQGTPEFAYGITEWWEGGFYLPFAVNSAGEALSDGAKIRSLFVIPDAAKRSFFYGVNFELGYELPQFSLTRAVLRASAPAVESPNEKNLLAPG
jgi:hypothetical protein